MTPMTKVAAIRNYFERKDKLTPEGGRKCTFDEIKQLTSEDREELALLASKELGVEIQQ